MFTASVENLNKALKRLACLPTSSSGGNIGADHYVTIDAGIEGLNFMRIGTSGKVSFDCEADIEDSGTYIVGFKLLHSILNKNAGMISVTKKPKSNFLTLASSSRSYEVPIISQADAGIPPYSPEPGKKLKFSMPKLATLFRRCNCATRHDAECGEMLGGVCFRDFSGELCIFATDRRRIHHYKTGVQNTGIDVMVPSAIVDAISGIFGDFEEVSLEFSEKTVMVSVPAGRYIAPLGVKTPPNIAPVLAMDKEANFWTTFDRDEMLEAVKAAMPLAQGENKAVTLRFLEDACELSATESESNASSNETIRAKGDVFTVQMNVGYFIEWLTAMNGGPTKIGFVEKNIAMFCSKDEATLYICTLRFE